MADPIDLKAIQEADEKTKKTRWNQVWCQLSEYFDDCSRHLTVENLKRLGLGLSENSHPIEVNLLAYVMGRLSVVYSDSSTRWLLQDEDRLSETSAQHKLLQKQYKRSKVDIAMRQAAINAALLGQVGIRLYPTDSTRSISLRLFRPQHMFRDVDPGTSDQIGEDKRFALELADEVFECWEKTVDGYRMQWLDKDGHPLPDEVQPFADTGGISPYTKLPILILYDRWPGGQAWLPPKESRVSLVSAINAAMNDILNLCAIQGHGQWVYKREDPNARIPEQTGASVVWEVGKGDDVLNVTPQANLEGVRQCMREYIAALLSQEGLPADELEKDRQVFSGAQLQVAERPLSERREEMIPMAAQAETELFEGFRAMYAHHVSRWEGEGAPIFDEDTELSVEFGEVDTPVDAKDLTETVTNQLAARLISPVDALRRVHRCTREEAIQIHARIEQDFELYPLRPESDLPAPEGTQADPNALDAVNALNGQNADSMVDAANGVSAADRRELRR